LFVGDFSELQEWSRFFASPVLYRNGRSVVCFSFLSYKNWCALANSECCEETMTHVFCQAVPQFGLPNFCFISSFFLTMWLVSATNWWAAFMVIGRGYPGPQSTPKLTKMVISKCWLRVQCTFWSQIVSQSGSPPPHAHTMSD